MTEPNDDVLTQNQREYREYKQRTARTGKAFFPYAMWHDAVVSALVVGIIILLSVLWFSDAACGQLFDVSCEQARSVEHQEESKPLLGPLYEEKAEPSTTKYHPRPEWYFYFLFQLLIIFSNPQLVLLGTIGVPTIALVLLLAWPFIDRRRERRPSRRPVAMVAMTATAVALIALSFAGSKAGEAGTVEEGAFTEAQQEMEGFQLLLGEGADDRMTCNSCHTLDGAGWNGTVGPGLTDEGTKDRGVEWQFEHLKDPPSKVPGSTMPAQTQYNDEELRAMAEFLETLGTQ